MTLSEEEEHAPFAMVHLSVAAAPMVSLDSELRGLLGKSMFAAPDMSVHVPVPTVAVFPASVALVTLHNAISVPAAAVVGTWSTCMLMVSVAAAHVPLLTVHTITEAAPGVNPVTPEVGEAGVVATADPEKVDHAPVPAAGLVAASVETVTLHRAWSAPAAAAGTASMRIFISSAETVHAPLEMVHLSVAVPAISPVTPEEADAGVVTEAVPAITDHAPVPVVAGVAAKVVVVTLQNA